jgi:hypothetical protein
MAVLEWCKLFAARKAKHYWRKLVGHPENFMVGLLQYLEMTEAGFDAFIAGIRTYRDKFVAHLDDEPTMNIPNMIPAIESAQYLYQWLLEQENDCDAFPDAPPDSIAYYRERLLLGEDAFARQPRPE